MAAILNHLKLGYGGNQSAGLMRKVESNDNTLLFVSKFLKPIIPEMLCL
jgi:hypothetical protein